MRLVFIPGAFNVLDVNVGASSPLGGGKMRDPGNEVGASKVS